MRSITRIPSGAIPIQINSPKRDSRIVNPLVKLTSPKGPTSSNSFLFSSNNKNLFAIDQFSCVGSMPNKEIFSGNGLYSTMDSLGDIPSTE